MILSHGLSSCSLVITIITLMSFYLTCMPSLVHYISLSLLVGKNDNLYDHDENDDLPFLKSSMFILFCTLND